VWVDQDESASEESELFTEPGEELAEECGMDVEVVAGGGRGGGAL
jgi:hypothetical protein